jgi:host factor-I protein
VLSVSSEIIPVRLGTTKGRLARPLKGVTSVAAQGTPSIQDMFLKHLRDNRVEVTIFLVTGIRLQGRIKRYDSYTVELARGDSSQIIYKHAISAINPAEPVELTRLTNES